MKSRSFVRLLVSSLLLASTAAFAGEKPPLQIIVSKDQQVLTVYDGDTVVATSNVSTGKPGHTTPSGIFSVIEKQQFHRSNKYSNAPMPWMQRITWSGVALHESASVPNYPASHGCVRLPAKFAKSLYQLTGRSAHVIISDEPVAPVRISHKTLFLPKAAPTETQLLTDAVLRPAIKDATLHRVELAMNDVLPKVGAAGKIVLPEKLPPIRMLITWRSQRDKNRDVQATLTALGYETGDHDGILGAATQSAIAAFKASNNLPGDNKPTDEFIAILYKIANKPLPGNGQLSVRRNFKHWIDSPVTIAEPEKALGTHLLEAYNTDGKERTADWFSVTLDNHLSKTTMQRLGIKQPADPQAYDAASSVLDRITIPDDIRAEIETALGDGSSITITDTGTESETGLGTDFVTITKPGPKDNG